MKRSIPVSFRMDAELKRKTDETLDEMGLTMSSAFTALAKAIVRTGTLPFDLMVDPFYKAENRDELERRIELFEKGKTQGKQVVKTIDELEAIASGCQNSNV